jgi:PAS domain S-box-containing protein
MVDILPEKLVGAPFLRLVAEKDRALFREVLEKSARGQAHADVIHLSGNGGDQAVRLSGSVRTLDNNTTVVCMIVTDITKRVQAEDALRQAKDRLEQAIETLRESQARYLDLYENAHDIVFALDLHGNFTSANHITYTELGLEPENVIGKHFPEIFTSESACAVFQLIENSLEPHVLEEQPWEFEATSPNGSVVNFEVRTRLIRNREAIGKE